jgi:RNA polymerase sigma-70 factor, ECF subfamily
LMLPGTDATASTEPNALEPWASDPASPRPTFDQIYAEGFPFVFRLLRSLGVTPVRLEDAAQDVFTVVHRRLGDFERRSSVRTWLFGIAQRVASDYRRSERRKPTRLEPLPADLSCERASPHADLEAQRAADFVDAFLRSLGEEKRALFALAFLEEMPATEVAEALGIPLNTVYSRIRSLRAELAKALKRRNTR